MSGYRLYQVKTDLSKYKEPRLPRDSDSYILGGLNGNAIKLIRFLIETQTVSIEPYNYNKLYSVYEKRDINGFETYLSSLKINTKRRKFNPSAGRLILLGDTVCGRGSSDYMTMLVLEYMHKNKVPFSIVCSYYDIIPVLEYDLFFNGGKTKTSLPGPKYHRSFDYNRLDNRRKKRFLNIFNNIYYKSLRVFEELEIFNKNQGKKEILLFSHAPCHPKTLNSLISLLDRNKRLATAGQPFINPYKFESYSKHVLESRVFQEFISDHRFQYAKFNRNPTCSFTKDAINVFGSSGNINIPKNNNFLINLDSDLGMYFWSDHENFADGVMSVLCVHGILFEQDNSKNSLKSAIGDYLNFLTKKGTFGFFHRHGDDGRRRALELQRRIDKIDETDYPTKYSWLISQYFNNKIVTNEKGQRIGGAIRANPHSFISYFLNADCGISPNNPFSTIKKSGHYNILSYNYLRNKSEVNQKRKEALLKIQKKSFHLL